MCSPGGVRAYPWSSSTGFGIVYTDPVGQPAQPQNISFSPTGTAVAISHTGTPFITAYPWSVGGGFGTKYANPATLPPSNGQDVAFTQI
jgi:hypothetical protein